MGHRFVSGLRIDHDLLYRVRSGEKSGQPDRWEVLHLQQSALDAACGLHCALMACGLALGLPRDRATSVARSTRPSLRKLWTTAKTGYFSGVTPTSMVQHLTALCSDLPVSQRSGSHAELFELTVKEIQRDNLVVILIGDSPTAGLHWVLCIGVEMDSKARASGGKDRKEFAVALLGLDPASPPPVLGAFNFRLPRRRGQELPRAGCVTTNGPDRYRRLQRAVILHRSD